MTTSKKPAAQTGPKSARGKASSSRNAQTHGLLSRHLIIAGEDRSEFDLLLATLQTELRPVGLLENSLAERMAVTLWRQRRLVKAESAGITLRAAEKTGSVVSELRNYLAADTKIAGLQAALDGGTDDSIWTELLAEVEGFDPNQASALLIFSKRCPHAYAWLSDEAAAIGYGVEDYLPVKHKTLARFLEWWNSFLQSQRNTKQTVAVFRESRAMPENPDILVRYQSGLDNELYKAMRALREAQAWRLSTLEQVDASG